MRRRERFMEKFRDARKYRSVPMQIFDLIIHKLKINTYWEDYYRFGFYRQDKSWEERSMYLGERGSKYWPWESNSLKFDSMFIRKSLQKAITIAYGLPTPHLLMTVGKYYPINTRALFTEELAEISEPFILKIDGGMRGLAIYLFEPESGGFRHKNEVVTADWIWDRFRDNLDPGYIIEERVDNHPELNDVCSDALCTLRLVTVRTGDGELHLLCPFIKFGRQGSHVDNLKAGGILAVIDENYCLGTGVNQVGEEFEIHPDTGAQITGRKIPLCEEAFQLALDASRVFGYMGSIGWDIGITPDGPVIIEGNTRWGSDVIQDFIVPYLTPEVAAGLMPRSWWTPWDKTHIYPLHIYNADGGWWQKRLAKRRKSWSG